MGGRSPEAGEQLVKATETIAETLSSYLSLKLNKSCAKLRNIDPEWFDNMFTESINEFKLKSMSEIKDLIDFMEVSKRAAVIHEANKNCIVKRPWRPSGNPENDTNAHIYEMEKEYHQLLATETQNRYRSLKAKMSELRTIRRTEMRSLESLEEIAKSFEDV
ncbi:unnamed protein product [Hymenolepis diminuta]|uniref:Uncharacterized protein n=1 Tax=Hymenolepis diminuta TaxID=6216 RepID=A0A0R3SR15_HYMDI|nr:unnamed protein product [Hymenolepis diminuta]VUZ56507.1 unnamed protein product [Hymenolepis diminuta]